MAIEIAIGSRVYEWPQGARAQLDAMRALLEEEEQRILGMVALFPRAPEHFLIHQVRMYLFRFAIPAVEIEAQGIENLDSDRVRERLWLCLLGRGLDDIVDGDSLFFSAGESAVLLTAYSRLLDRTDSERLYRAMSRSVRPPDCAEDPSSVTFDDIRRDVCRRVDYYMAPTASAYPERLGRLETFVGVTLGACDLVDVLADRSRSATMLSQALRRDLADEEGKVLLGASLLSWFVQHANLLMKAGEALEGDLLREGVSYAASVIADQRESLARQLAASTVSFDTVDQ